MAEINLLLLIGLLVSVSQLEFYRFIEKAYALYFIFASC